MLGNIKKILKIYLFKEKLNISKEEKKAYIMLAADYGNLGDVAITYAQRKYIEEKLPGFKIIEITIKEFYRKYLCIKRNLNPKDIITIIGGGNTGDVYPDFEDVRRFIIKKFKTNKIISFPQTIDFRTEKELKKSVNIYKKNHNLYLFAREQKSFTEYKTKFENKNIFLVPDIVLSLNKIDEKAERKNITICLRNDVEKQTKHEEENQLLEKLKEEYKNLVFQDTHIGNRKINYEERETELDKILKIFSSSKIVITDRLHGLIFSVITGTPCIALDNINHKIRETYNTWLKENNDIYFFEKVDIEKIINIIDKYNKLNNYKSNFINNRLNNSFIELEKVIMQEK